MRATALAAAALLGGALSLVLIGMAAGPLTRTCAPDMSVSACDGALGAVMRRGLPAAHPLILAAHVQPGTAPAPDAHGHRATVTLELLAPIPPVGIEVHFDQGGHWGGVSERSPLEVVAWSSAPLVAAALAAGALLGLARWRRGKRAR